MLARTSGWNIPLLVGEWGVRRDDARRDVYQAQMLSLFDSLKVNWTRWNLDRTRQYGLLDVRGKLNDNGLEIARHIGSTPATGPGVASPGLFLGQGIGPTAPTG